ncbi:MAG: type I DNA topoisomerase [Saprospiraceae bacterium]|nr:type I DNA topoisomerase [Saprospiraceae bacterium]
MAKNLLIVESPAKAKTIEKFLGKDFVVKSSYGHVRDLEKGNKGIDIENDFEPNYVVQPDKLKVVKELKDYASKSEEIWLATDEDREGEAISWHLAKVLGLDLDVTKRIVFREITKQAIQKAITQPRKVDLNLVDAQQARRILDRLVGFELSELLWKKIKGQLSAGRVQSVAVKLVVDREREIKDFKISAFYKISALFEVQTSAGKNTTIKAELPDQFATEKDAETFLSKCIGAEFKIKDIQVKPLSRKPSEPFTTSTLQQEASRKLGFSVQRTMIAAQKLYEAGYISYMRTDSVNLSETAIAAIAAEISSKFGEQYVQTRRYKSKNASAQEAHEAIRPSYIDRIEVASDRDQQKLYELIWKRTIASQMSEAKIEKTIVQISISSIPQSHLIAEGEVLKFDGFLKVYLESKDDDEEDEKGMLPPLKIGQILPLIKMDATERFTRPPARYTEASLVKKLEELGIGRPSTFAPTIGKIMEEKRGYVVKLNKEGVPRTFQLLTLQDGKIQKTAQSELTGAAKNHLFPTDMGGIVCDFLSDHFQDIMSYSFTADIEKKLDDVAEGDTDWKKLLKSFYGPFHKNVLKTEQNAERATGERILGTDPVTGKTVLVRMSRFGRPVVQIGTGDELLADEKPAYANLKPGQGMDEIELSDALELFKLPKSLGEYEGEDIIVASGRFGPFIKFGTLNVTLPKGADPMALTYDEAVECIQQKKQADAPIAEFEGLPVTAGSGRFGPFIKWNDMYINVPKKYDLATLTQTQINELIEAKQNKESNRFVHNWPDLKLSVENGRWGPFIRFGKKFINLPKNAEGKKMTESDATQLDLNDIKKLVEAEVPGAFDSKKKTKTKK